MEVRKGYKQTEVGIIPEDWKLVELRNLAKYRRGSFPQPYGLSKWYDDVSGNPFIQVVDVDNNFKLKPETKKRLSAEAEKMSVFAPKGSVILSLNGSVGRVALTQYDGFIDRTLLLFESFSIPIDRHYFIYAVSAVFHEEEKKAPGAILKTITKEHLSNFLLPVPTLAEQEAIAEALSDADTLIESLETLLAKKRQVKQGAMSELLSGKRRLPGFSGEWNKSLIQDLEKKKLIQLSRGKVISKKDIANKPGDYPIYSSSVKNEGLFGSYGDYMFDEELITWSVDGGGDFFYRHKHRFSITNVSGFMRVDVKNINYQFLAYQLQVLHSRLNFDYQIKAHPSVIRKSYEVSLPEMSEQTAIAEILSDMDAEIRAVEEKLSKARAVKAGMMSELLTGRIRLNHD